MTEPRRPDPDILLSRIAAEDRRGQRGAVKIFFGPVAGSGKTYAMLEAARAQLAEGVDVLAGVVETHRRPETEKLLQGIPVLPQKQIDHNGVMVREFDLDAALARKPRILLLDELAHTNAPGCRHPKRWQDMEELRNAGIDVYTTLNVQHLESLSDVVAGATGIWVKETVPDSVFDTADDIELIDLPADDILKRLQEGKIYLADGAAERATQNFFRKANLISLREIALRRTADRVDAQLGAYHEREGLGAGPAIAEKIIACINADPLSAKVVRSARRMASSLKAPWTAVYVEDARQFARGERGRQAVQTVLRLAERLGGKTAVVQGNSALDELLAFAQKNGATKIIVGKPLQTGWRRFLRQAFADRLLRRQGDIDIYIIAGKPAINAPRPISLKALLPDFRPGQYFWSSVVIAACTGFGLVFGPIIQPIDQALIYLIGNVAVAAWFGRGPAILYALLSATCLNFFFVPPLYTLQIQDRSYWLTLAVMLITGGVITSFASRLRLQAIFSRRREAETQMLYQMTRQLAVTRGRAEIAHVAASHILDLANIDVAVWLRRGPGQPAEHVSGTFIAEDPEKESAILDWVVANNRMAGQGTTTMPGTTALYLPLASSRETYGALALRPKIAGYQFTQGETALFETFASLLASALERAQAGEAASLARIETEREKLRSTLLSSVSHDLRTPLASITGASSSIMEDGNNLSPAVIRDLARSIHQESARLSRLVANLLDITRLETGKLALNAQPYFLDEVIGAVLTSLQKVMAGHHIETHLPEDLPMIAVDGQLIEQLFANLLENAARYTPAESRVIIAATTEDNRVAITVTDNGPGVLPGTEKMIFDKFYTLANRAAQKGSGLGLAICQAIIHLHGGEITARNLQEGGVRFAFTLPIAAAPKQDEADDD